MDTLTLYTKPATKPEAMAHYEQRTCAEDHPSVINDGPADYLLVYCPECRADDCRADD